MSYYGHRGQPHIAAELIGVPTTTLSAWLVEAQTALQQLEMGNNPNAVSYSQGSGGGSTTFSAATPAALRARIRSLTIALGLTPRRKPMQFGF